MGTDSIVEAQNVYQTLLIKFIAFDYSLVIIPPSGQFTILNFESRDHWESLSKSWANCDYLSPLAPRLYFVWSALTEFIAPAAIELSRRKFKNSNAAQPLARFIVSRK